MAESRALFRGGKTLLCEKTNFRNRTESAYFSRARNLKNVGEHRSTERNHGSHCQKAYGAVAPESVPTEHKIVLSELDSL